MTFMLFFQAGQTLGASSLLLSGHKPAPGPASLASLAGLLTQAESGASNNSPSPSQRTQMQKPKLSLSIPTVSEQPPAQAPLLRARVHLSSITIGCLDSNLNTGMGGSLVKQVRNFYFFICSNS
jgi:hypothetical protein